MHRCFTKPLCCLSLVLASTAFSQKPNYQIGIGGAYGFIKNADGELPTKSEALPPLRAYFQNANKYGGARAELLSNPAFKSWGFLLGVRVVQKKGVALYGVDGNWLNMMDPEGIMATSRLKIGALGGLEIGDATLRGILGLILIDPTRVRLEDSQTLYRIPDGKEFFFEASLRWPLEKFWLSAGYGIYKLGAEYVASTGFSLTLDDELIHQANLSAEYDISEKLKFVASYRQLLNGMGQDALNERSLRGAYVHEPNLVSASIIDLQLEWTL